MSKKLWARLGMSCEVSDSEYEKLNKLIKENPGDAASMLYNLFTLKGKYNGDNYLVANSEDNPNIDSDFNF